MRFARHASRQAVHVCLVIPAKRQVNPCPYKYRYTY
jgi:hypothetical protein